MRSARRKDDEDAQSQASSSAASDDNLKNLEWTDNLETLMSKWSDEALSYAWLHVKAESKFRKLNYGFTIPIVVLSTLTGSINLAMSSMIPAQYATLGNLATGGLSIFTGILGTLLNFFKYAQTSEAHRNASVQWHKFYRNIKTELALDRICRKPAPSFYISSKNEMDRLLDSSPNIPSEITQKYKERTNIEIDLPDIIGDLHRTKVFRGPQVGFVLSSQDLEDMEEPPLPSPNTRRVDIAEMSSASLPDPREQLKSRMKSSLMGGLESLKLTANPTFSSSSSTSSS